MSDTADAPWTFYSARRRWLLLFVLFLVSTSSYVDRVVISVLLEPIKAEFAVSDAVLGLLSGVSFALFYAVLGLPISRFADRGNRKLLITISLSVWSVMTALCGLASSFGTLMLARIGVGAGEAGCVPAAQSLIADYFAPAQRGRAIAVLTMSGTVGYIVALSLGGQAVAQYGWRVTFVVFGLPGLLIAVMAYLVLHEPRAAQQMQHRVVETFDASVRRLCAKKAYLFLLAGNTVYFFVAYGSLVFVPSYLVRVAGIPIATAGLSYGISSAASVAIGSFAGGYLSDRLSRRDRRWLTRLPAIALLLASIPSAGMFLIDDLGWFLVLSTIGGIGLNMAVPTIYAAIHAVCGTNRRATALAIVFFFGNLFGFGLGPVSTGFISDIFSAEIGPAGLRYALVGTMLLAIPAGLLIHHAGRFVRDDVEA